jgi:DNA-directed RNA polymerase subunit RPC12/RpoP
MKALLFFMAIILILVGFGALSSSPLLAVLLLFIGSAMLIYCLKRKTEPDARVSLSIQSTSVPTSRKDQKSKRTLKPVGNVEAICPHCNKPLDKKPGRKKKCPHCGEFIFVRTRPSDEQRVLVTEAQVEEIKEQWSIVNGTHAEYLDQKKRFSDEKAKLAKRFGREPSENDIKWSLLNKDLIGHANNANWGLYRNAKFEMAEILRKESRTSPALELYLEVLYLDVNGPNNTGGIRDPDLLKEFPPFNKKDAFLAPGVVSIAAAIIQELELDDEGVNPIFYKIAERNFTSLRLPITPDAGWGKIKKELFK